MRQAAWLLVLALVAVVSTSCGSPRLEGVTLGDIQLEGELADEFTAELEEALTSAGANLHQEGQPDLEGTITWEWAGEGGSRYPTLIKIFMQDPEKRYTITAQYAVPEGAQPRDVSHYQDQLIDRIVSRIAAESRDARS